VFFDSTSSGYHQIPNRNLKMGIKLLEIGTNRISEIDCVQLGERRRAEEVVGGAHIRLLPDRGSLRRWSDPSPSLVTRAVD
jgi:hypothetical protein